MDYGGRGIKIYSGWRHNPEAFVEYVERVLGARPSSSYTLDRVDNDDDYCPGNIRWATKTQQGRNKRNNIVIYFEGSHRTLAECCEMLGLAYASVYKRITRHNWEPLVALTTPIGQKGNQHTCIQKR